LDPDGAGTKITKIAATDLVEPFAEKIGTASTTGIIEVLQPER